MISGFRRAAAAIFSASALFLGVFCSASGLCDCAELPEMAESGAEAVFVAELSTGAVIYGKNEDERLYPASTTKLMTALLAAEHIESGKGSLDDIITFSRTAVFGIPRDTMHISLDEGEELTVLQTLYAILLPSANDASMGMAEYVAGSVPAFVEMMNQRAGELGLLNTHYENPHGLHHENHYTTAKELGELLKAAAGKELLREIMSARSYQIPPTNKNPETRYLSNTNRLIQTKNQYYDERVVLGKTGFTTPAGNTLATISNVNGMTCLVALMKCGQGQTFADTAAILDYVEQNVQMINIEPGDCRVYIPAGATSVAALPENGLNALLPAGADESGLRLEYSLPETIESDVKKGDVLGSVTAYFGEFPAGKADMIAGRDYVLAAAGTAAVTERPAEVVPGEKTGGAVSTALLIALGAALLGGISYLAVVIFSVAAHNRQRKIKGGGGYWRSP